MPYQYSPAVGSLSRRGIFTMLKQSITQMIEQKVDRFRNESDRYLYALSEVETFAARMASRIRCRGLAPPPRRHSLLPHDQRSVHRPRPRDERFFFAVIVVLCPGDAALCLNVGHKQACKALDETVL